MLILKLAGVTCAFYLGAAVLVETAMWVLDHRAGGIVVTTDKPEVAAGIFFGAIWLASFLLAWRIIAEPIFAAFSK